MKVKSIANWYGGNRTLAGQVGNTLGRCRRAVVPFCGGCSELPHIDCWSGVANDLHRHVINLARCIADPEIKAWLAKELDATLYHPDVLAESQRLCREHDSAVTSDYALPSMPNAKWAKAYFICCWMGRGGKSGTRGEFEQGISVRYDATGGDTCGRFRGAVDSLDAWYNVVKRWNFKCADAFELLGSCKDASGIGIYCDPPWVEEGGPYRHSFGNDSHRKLASVLRAFRHAKVVVRYGDHPLIRELYPITEWSWIEQTSRAQSNRVVTEVLIVKEQQPAGDDARLQPCPTIQVR